MKVHAAQSPAYSVARTDQGSGLTSRIALVGLVVMAELWALTAAIEAWAEGRTAVLGWIVGFQFVCFLLAVSVSMAAPTPGGVRLTAGARSVQSAAE